MDYGFKTQYNSIFDGLAVARTGNPAKGVAPRDISLRQYISENFHAPDKTPLTMEHFLAELGIEDQTTRAKDLFDQERGEIVAEAVREGIRRGMGLQARDLLAALRRAVRSFAITGEHSGGAPWISPEVFLDPAIRGAIQANFHQELVRQEIMVNNLSVTVPKIELSDANTKKRRKEGATRTVGTVIFGSKQVTIDEFEKGIEFSDESLMFNSLDFVSIFFEDLGGMLGADLNNEAVYVLINGDQIDGSEAAAVVGVETIGDIVYKDILRILMRLAIMNRRATSMVGNEVTSVDYLDLPEVKNKNQLGTELLRTNVKTSLPTELDLFTSSEVPDDQLAFEDTTKSLAQLTAKALSIESDRNVKKSLNGSYARIYTGFTNLQRNSRVVLDRSIDFATHGFPSWMSAYTGRAI